MREVQDLGAVRLPAQVGLDGDADDDVARQLGRLRDGELRRGPDDLPLCLGAALEADVRPGQTEMVKVFGVDLGKLLRVERRAEVPGGRGGRLRRVVPAAEGGDQYRAPKALGHGVDAQRIHRLKREFITRLYVANSRCSIRNF
jgi:hypothetical protein